MKRYLSLFLVTLIFFGQSANAAESFAPVMQVDETKLVLNGKGTRKKVFISLYDAGLYLPNRSTDAASIVDADEVMAMELLIKSDLITAKKMEKAILEGFAKATKNNVAPIATEIDQFLNAFRSGVKTGDRFSMIYHKGDVTEVMRNGEIVAEVASLAFKQALFGIWLSNNPVQKSLRKALLGKR